MFRAQTVDGPKTIETVTGTLSRPHPRLDRDRRPSRLDPRWRARGSLRHRVLLELAQVLSAQTQQRSVVLASTSASIGAAGAAELAQSLPQPVDAVIVLGDMAGTDVRTPLVVPVVGLDIGGAAAVADHGRAGGRSSRPGLSAGEESIGGQFLHLAFPLAASEQRPFADSGEPAVLISASGSRVPAADEPTTQGQIGEFGRAVLQSVSALESAESVPAPSSYLRGRGTDPDLGRPAARAGADRPGPRRHHRRHGAGPPARTPGRALGVVGAVGLHSVPACRTRRGGLRAPRRDQHRPARPDRRRCADARRSRGRDPDRTRSRDRAR